MYPIFSYEIFTTETNIKTTPDNSLHITVIRQQTEGISPVEIG